LHQVRKGNETAARYHSELKKTAAQWKASCCSYSKMKIAVVTNCTSNKALVPSRQLKARFLPVGSASQVGKIWQRQLHAADQRLPAKRLYQGRGFGEAVLAAQVTGTALHIISAGVGFISAMDVIPPYNLTMQRDHPDSILNKIPDDGPADWWSSINTLGVSKKRLTEWITSTRDTLVVFSLTPSYLALIGEELCALASRDLERLRIIGPREKSLLPDPLKQLTMPYDSRLNGPDSPIKGTESDFPQRAARHFVGLLREKRGIGRASRDAKLVERAQEHWRPRVSPVRRRLVDAELRKVIQDVLRISGGRWTVALRVLRRDLKIACEQNRFREICQSILTASDD
jgi:hypothetical protein